MKSPSKTYLFSLIILLLLVSTVIPAHGQDGPFEDTFDDPDLLGWQHTPNVYVVDGYLRVEPGGFASPEGNWGAFEMVMRARYTGSGEMAILYNMSEAGASILLFNGSRFQAQRENGGLVENVGEPTSFNLPPGEWVQLTMLVGPNELQVLVNDELAFTELSREELSAGGFGFETMGDLVLELEHFTLIPFGIEPVDEPIPEAQEEPLPISSDRPPAYQAGTWTHLGGPIGGLGYDIRYSFDDHDTWYVTDAWAGIHRCTDRGLTWEPINQGITAIKGVDAVPIFSVTVDPHDSQVVWIGTEGTGGIYRTADGGDTWVEMINGTDQTLRPLTFRGFTVDPTRQDTVFAMGEISSIAWTPDGQQLAGFEMDLTMGIVYKTTDGGKNWIEVWRGNNLARYAWINPKNPNIVYVSTGIFDRESANTDVEAGFAGGVGILKSTDGGITWRVLSQENGLLDLYIGSLYMHPEDPDTLLAAASQNNWSAYVEDNTAGLYLSNDGGETWERVESGQELYATVEYCDANP